MSSGYPDRYFTERSLVEEATRTLETARHVGVDTGEGKSIQVPDAVEDIMRNEAFYCRANVDEMPYRIALYGNSLVTLAEKGASFAFAMKSGPARTLPFMHPLPNESEAFPAVIDTLNAKSSGGSEVQLTPITAALLEAREQQNGFSAGENFIAMAGILNYIGVAERTGLALTIFPAAP